MTRGTNTTYKAVADPGKQLQWLDPGRSTGMERRRELCLNELRTWADYPDHSFTREHFLKIY